LRGRSGRQGDPGESRFYLSLEDDLMRRFNSQLTERVMSMTGFPEDLPLESKLVTRGIASAQSQVESTNFEIRKNVLKYDDVMNRQRTVVYEVRRAILHGEDLEGRIQGFLDDVTKSFVEEATSSEAPEEWDLDQLWTQLKAVFPATVTPDDLIAEVGSKRALTKELLDRELESDIHLAYETRETEIGPDAMRELERRVLLAVLDRKWREHLYEMDYLKEGIGLRAMAQRDPLVEYQREGYHMFLAMNEAIKEETVGYLFNLEVQVADAAQSAPAARQATATVQSGDGSSITAPAVADSAAGDTTVTATAPGGPGREPARVGAQVVAKGLEGPREDAGAFQYSAPSEDGGDQPVVRRNRAASAEDKPKLKAYPGTGRNKPCPCGSGKKYKMCHGKDEA
jgi:preprotein translocase subunit SecA